jgi:adenylate kinase family enzyme
MKIVITGNSGSGKTWLARKIAPHESKIIHLDTIFWEPGGFDKKRWQREIDNLISQNVNHKEWIAEGVFGELINRFMYEASIFILLDMPWELCRKRLENRGSESKKHMCRTQSSEGLKKLNDWAQQYYERTNLTSKFGRQQLFEPFKGTKALLKSEEEVINYISKLHNLAF